METNGEPYGTTSHGTPTKLVNEDTPGLLSSAEPSDMFETHVGPVERIYPRMIPAGSGAAHIVRQAVRREESTPALADDAI
jgi:hypothetical protein